MSTRRKAMSYWRSISRGGLGLVDPAIVDAGLAAAVALAISLPFVLPRSADEAPVTVLGFVLALGTAIPLIWRRRAPLSCALVVSGFTVAVALYRMPGQPLSYGLLIALYTVAGYANRRPRLAMLAGVVVGVTVTAFARSEAPVNYAFTLLLHVGAYVLGRTMRLKQAYAEAVEERAARLERERVANVERARAAERARIAHDMHDVLAHAVSLMLVQAEAGPVVVKADPARTTETFDRIAAAGRDAMTQLRRILSTLGQDDAVGDRLELAALPALVDRVRQSGLEADFTMPADLTGLAPDIQAAAFRIIQEALTNTLKHAAALRVEIRLEVHRDMLTVMVRDDGRGPTDSGESGLGLLGIRERAHACGGTVRTGAGADGSGFVVDARLPLAWDASAS